MSFVKYSKHIFTLTLLPFLLSAQFPLIAQAHPGSGIAVDKNGQVFFLDTGSGLWKLDTLDQVTRMSTNRFHWLTIDEDRQFEHCLLSSSTGDIVKVGSHPTILISSDYPVAAVTNGKFYYPSNSNSGVKIISVSPSGEFSTFCTLPPASDGKPLSYISGFAAGPDGELFYTDDNSVYKISKAGEVSRIVTVPSNPTGPSIPGVENSPYLRGLAVDSIGTIYVADNADGRLLKITGDKKVSTVYRIESPWAPTAVAIYHDVIYVQEYFHTKEEDRLAWLPRIRKITPDGKSSIILTVDRMPGAR